LVDGLGVGDVEEVVLRDRRRHSPKRHDRLIVTMERGRMKLVKSPDIISRGFIYLKENQEVLEEIRKRIRGLLGRLPERQEPDPDYLKTLIRTKWDNSFIIKRNGAR